MLVCIPSYFMFRIQATIVLENDEVIVLYHVGLSGVAREDDELLYYINFWIYGIIIKLLPCVILTVISCWLIKALYRANRRKQALKGKCPLLPQQIHTLWGGGGESTITGTIPALDDECGSVGGIIGKGNRSIRRKPAPVPICPTEMSYELNLVQTRAPRRGGKPATNNLSYGTAAIGGRIILK
jgi:hypothetical protein